MCLQLVAFLRSSRPMTFSPLNLVILAVYLTAMVLIGLRFAGRQKTGEDYFLAGRKMPWLPVAMSMFASLTSATTYLALPGKAYGENISLVVVCFVSPLLAPFLIFVFYPFYRRLRVTTSYEYLGARFGRRARVAASALFLLARLGWLGAVIYAPALALSTVSGLSLGRGHRPHGRAGHGLHRPGRAGGGAVDRRGPVRHPRRRRDLGRHHPGRARSPAGRGQSSTPPGRRGTCRSCDWRPSLTEMTGLTVALSFFSADDAGLRHRPGHGAAPDVGADRPRPGQGHRVQRLLRLLHHRPAAVHRPRPVRLLPAQPPGRPGRTSRRTRCCPSTSCTACRDGVSGPGRHRDLRRGHVQHGLRHQLAGHGDQQRLREALSQARPRRAYHA